MRTISRNGFGELAQSYSDDAASKQLKGDEGIVEEAQLLPEVATALANHKKNEYAIVGSRSGLHILYIYDIATNEKGTKSYGIKQVFLKAQGFDEWLAKETGSIDAHLYTSP
jgi:parvulin-like peptidyl-prolyl isomerase